MVLFDLGVSWKGGRYLFPQQEKPRFDCTCLNELIPKYKGGFSHNVSAYRRSAAMNEYCHGSLSGMVSRFSDAVAEDKRAFSSTDTGVLFRLLQSGAELFIDIRHQQSKRCCRAYCRSL